MASTTDVKCVTLTAGEALGGDLYEIVQVENDSDVGKVIKTTGPTNSAIGVVYESLDTARGADGNAVQVALFAGGGIIEVKAGAAITAGDLVTMDTTAGRAASAGANLAAVAADVVVIGVALESAADGDIFRMLAQPMTSALQGA